MKISMYMGQTPSFRLPADVSVYTKIIWKQELPLKSKWDRAQSRESADIYRAQKLSVMYPEPE